MFSSEPERSSACRVARASANLDPSSSATSDASCARSAELLSAPSAAGVGWGASAATACGRTCSAGVGVGARISSPRCISSSDAASSVARWVTRVSAARERSRSETSAASCALKVVAAASSKRRSGSALRERVRRSPDVEVGGAKTEETAETGVAICGASSLLGECPLLEILIDEVSRLWVPQGWQFDQSAIGEPRDHRS